MDFRFSHSQASLPELVTWERRRRGGVTGNKAILLLVLEACSVRELGCRVRCSGLLARVLSLLGGSVDLALWEGVVRKGEIGLRDYVIGLYMSLEERKLI